jgi:hypothetical protein
MNNPKMNLKGTPGAGKNETRTPEEIQAQFFADLGNALINMANFTGRMAASLSELQKDFSSHAADVQDLLALKKLELEKGHGIAPDEIDFVLSEREDENEGDEKEDDSKPE